MTQTIISVVLFLAVLALLPLAVRWYQQRGAGDVSASAASRVVSILALGPQQRLVTVEVGPEGGRTWLFLGVTAQNITCVHSMPAPPAAGRFASQVEQAAAAARAIRVPARGEPD